MKVFKSVTNSKRKRLRTEKGCAVSTGREELTFDFMGNNSVGIHLASVRCQRMKVFAKGVFAKERRKESW
jgi:hypothetical protein